MKHFILILCVGVFAGCFAHAPAKDTSKSKPAIAVNGNVLSHERLKQGGKVGLALFKAGPQAESNEQLDRLAIVLLKGMRDRLETAESRLIITNNAEEADFIISGYIEEFTQPGKFQRVVMRKKKSNFAVSGEMWSRGSGQKVLVFSSLCTFTGKNPNVQGAVYDMGLSIGDFLIQNVN